MLHSERYFVRTIYDFFHQFNLSLYHVLSFQRILTKMFDSDPKIFAYYWRRKLGKSYTILYFQIGYFFLLFSFYQNSLSFVAEWSFWINNSKFLILKIVKFIYSEKSTKFCEIFPLLLTVCTVVKSKGKISQNFVAFSEYMNFITKFDCTM